MILNLVVAGSVETVYSQTFKEPIPEPCGNHHASACCCLSFFLLFHRRRQMTRRSLSVSQDTCAYMLLKHRSRADLYM